MRIPQHVSGALSACGGHVSGSASRRASRCFGRNRARRCGRHPCARHRDRGGCGGDQSRARAGPARASCGPAIRAAARVAQSPSGDRPAGAVGTAQAPTFQFCYLPEVLAGSVPCSLAAAFVAAGNRPRRELKACAAMGLLWYGAELALAKAAGWHVSAARRSAWVRARPGAAGDLAQGLDGDGFTWRGNDMTVAGLATETRLTQRSGQPRPRYGGTPWSGSQTFCGHRDRLPEHIDRDAAARIPVAANAQEGGLQQLGRAACRSRPCNLRGRRRDCGTRRGRASGTCSRPANRPARNQSPGGRSRAGPSPGRAT